ncbi:MAG: transcriptional regulator [Bacteroidetes bacterium]|nr:MAG: transcriptional regulator [Bacteroidota bacterium]
MPAIPTRLFLLLLFVLLQTNYFSLSQTSSLPLGKWKKELEVKGRIDDEAFARIAQSLLHRDSILVERALGELQNSGSSNHYYNTRILWLRADQVYTFRYNDQASLAKKYFEQALNEAYKTGDDNLIFSVSWAYASMMYGFQQIELAATYYLQAGEIGERLGKEMKTRFAVFLPLGEILFQTREYERSIYYLKKGLYRPENANILSRYDTVKYLNAIGQGYQQLGKLDSALGNYQQSLEVARKMDDSTWLGINSGFMGQVFFLEKEYDKAKSLLQYDYSINKIHEWNIAAYTLQWLAKINLLQGRKDSALTKVKEALNFLKKSVSFAWQKQNFLQSVYQTTADVYKASGNADSFYHYYQLYTSLHDSLERLTTLSSVKLAQLRIDNEKNYHTIRSLEEQKKAEVLVRNLIIALIILLSVIAFFYVNRLRLKHRHKEQLASQEMQAANAQLQLFTNSIIEKTNLIDQLEGQLSHRTLTLEQQELAASISSQTILTETDWEKFKTLFEKIYPGFFINLIEKVNDITLAEQRMAALTRLHLTTRQIASILGISPNSVNKTRQRLRQRLNLEGEVNIEEVIAKM